MFETCSLINKSCYFCFIAGGKEYCGLAYGKKYRTNIVAEMKQCPKKLKLRIKR